MENKPSQFAPYIVLLVVFVSVFFAVRYFMQTGAIIPSPDYIEKAKTVAQEKAAQAIPQPPYVFWQVEGQACVSCAAEKKDLEAIKPKLTGDITFETKNIVDDPELGEYFDISVLPTLMIFDSKNQLVFRYDGYLNATQLMQLFTELGVVKP